MDSFVFMTLSWFMNVEVLRYFRYGFKNDIFFNLLLFFVIIVALTY